jgi:hypothetical protein
VIVSDNQSFTALLVLMTINMLAFQIVTLIQVVFGPWSLPEDRKWSRPRTTYPFTLTRRME